MKKALASVALAITFFIAVPLPAYAANATFLGPIVPLECKCDKQTVEGGTSASGGATTVTTAPDYGCVLQVVQNVINFAITLSTILFVIYLTTAGFRLVISRGNSEALSQARTRLLNVFVGLMVMLCAWIAVDYFIKAVGYDDAKFGPWNAILANTAGDKGRCIVAKTPKPITDKIADIISGPGGGVAPGGGGSTDTGGSYNGSGFTYQSEVEKQVPYESGALGSLLSCMASKVPSGVGQISAITEKAIADGTKSITQCAATGCAHTANSCHYGGTGGSCAGKSYAVDFGDEGNATALRAAAKACNPNAKWNYEGNHVHISVGSASGCGCDTGLQAI